MNNLVPHEGTGLAPWYGLLINVFPKIWRWAEGKLKYRTRGSRAKLIYNLFTSVNITVAPYLLACASKIWADTDLKEDSKVEAVLELIRELRKEISEQAYMRKIMDELVGKSVWAACGLKSANLATYFYEANYANKQDGRYVERIFFPPRTQAELQIILPVIREHIIQKIVTRLFREQIGVITARSHKSFPEGFGMTLIGGCNQGDHDPAEKQAVLIHWGNVEATVSHLGVVLKSEAWLNFFWDEFQDVRNLTEIAGNDENSPIWGMYRTI